MTTSQPSIVSERARELGYIGNALLEHLPELPTGFESWSLVEQNAFIRDTRATRGELGVVAVSILASRVTVQQHLDPRTVEWVTVNGTAPLTAKPDEAWLKAIRGVTTPNQVADKASTLFPFKGFGAAEVKTNLKLQHVLRDVAADNAPAANEFMKILPFMDGLFNDQAAAVALYGATCYGKVKNAAEFALRCIKDPAGAKGITTVIKGLGLNATHAGALVCEMNTMLGRGVAPVNIVDEVRDRVGDAGRAKAPQLFGDSELRSAVRELLMEELDTERVEVMDKDDFWHSRWAWCVNGGHSRIVQKHDPRWAVDFPGQVHRRVAAEQWRTNPLDSWDGEVFVSASEKLEHGKTRLLLACDTVSYMCFEHMLRPIERAWRGKRILLDPGSMGQSGMAKKVRRDHEGEFFMMLDYDDFNAQHTLRAQQIVIEEAAALIGYDEAYTSRLVQSFDKMWLCAQGEIMGKAGATLMSGHRGTTFLNSILNAAYMKCAAPALWNRIFSLHTGDDVVATMPSFESATQLLDAMRTAGCKLNPLKQSIGEYCTEFLRLAMGPGEAYGYVARCIASLVSGNWVTDRAMRAAEAIGSLTSSVRALINRSRNSEAWRYCVTAANRRTSLKRRTIALLLSGRASYGSGPTFGGVGGELLEIEVADVDNTELEVERRRLPANAVNDYLTYKAAPVERLAMSATGSSVKGAMLDASYAKSLTAQTGHEVRTRAQATFRWTDLPVGSVLLDDVWAQRPKPGLLSRYPLLHLMKNRLRGSVLKQVLQAIGAPLGDDLYMTAWGSEGHGCRVVGTIPYSDASTVSSRTECGVVYVSYQVYM